MPQAPSPLAEKLRRRMETDGPLTVADYMETCLADPDHGYYATRDPLGARGDFTTAPEISQIFGELIGLWCVEVWRGMGAPAPFRLIELGPGRGTLMADMLRAGAIVPDFGGAADLHLVETSPVLRRQQREKLGGYSPVWHDALADVPAGPAILIANEFLDALPVRRFVRRGGGWREHCVGAAPDGGFVFTEASGPAPEEDSIPPEVSAAAQEGDIAETRPAATALAKELGERAGDAPVTALFVDYGHARSAPGDTFQAVAAHGFADPLEAPGERDLTAHVDFAALARSAGEAGLAAHGPMEQGRFLLALGLAERRDRLVEKASAEQARAIESGAGRLADPARMGALFKALALTGGQAPAPPPF